jgi:outer membrane protein TolC
VLTAFQEVEDNLATLRILEEEAVVQDAAVAAARQSAAYAMNQYREGTVSYLNVVVTQAAALTSERTAVNIMGRRMAASVLLVKALGGGWNTSALFELQGDSRDDAGRRATPPSPGGSPAPSDERSEADGREYSPL